MGQPAFSLYVNFESMVCGECGISFSFQNLARHMCTKHGKPEESK